MKPTEHLFDLIKSLNQSEKGYFKKFSQLHGRKGENNYNKLFDAIEKQESYNEAALLEQFAGERFIKNFSVAKNYLYNLILKCLEVYNNSTTYAELQSYLVRTRILLDKGLFEQCERMIERGRVMAEEHEASWFIAELNLQALELARVHKEGGITEGRVKEIAGELYRSIDSYSLICRFTELAGITSIVSGRGPARSQPEVDAARNMLDHELLRQAPDKHPFESRYYYHQIRSHYLIRTNDYRKAYHSIKKAIELLETRDLREDEDRRRYAHLLHNLVNCLLELRMYDEVPAVIQRMKSIAPVTDRLKNELFYLISNKELSFYLNTGHFDKGLECINIILSEQDKYSTAPLYKPSEIVLNYQFAYVYFGLKNFTASKRYINRILNDNSKDVRSDIYSFAWIMNLIINYELENDELMEYLVKSAYKFLYKRNRVFQVENVVLGFIRDQMTHLKSRKEMTVAFSDLHGKLITLARDPFEKHAFLYFDIISWLESRIKGQEFSEILREKAGWQGESKGSQKV